MGTEILQFYQTKLKKEYKIAFFSTFIIAMLIHIYKFVNTLPNHDSVYNYYSDQNMLGSGRWALSLACSASSYFDLPWVIGVVSCLFIALTAVVITAIFKLKNPVLSGLIGALLAASPATTETFFFLFTADGYMIAMFLAALAVYFSQIEENRLSRFILSGACICISCGIYQAYVSFALILALCYFMDELLQNKYRKQEYFKWILRQVVIYAVSLAVYFVIWKLCMHLTGTVANDYQGISEVGTMSAGLLVRGLLNSVKTTILYFLQWNVLEHGLTRYSILNLLFFVAMVIGICISCWKSGIFKRKWATALVVLCLAAVMPFACIWHFVSDDVGYRAMMLQSLTLLFVLMALLYERWTKPALKNIVCVFLLVVVANNALMANISYFYLNLCYERTYAEAMEMMMEIHNLQDAYVFDKIAVVGSRIHEVQLEDIDSETGEMQVSGKLHILSGGLEKTLLYDSDHTTKFLQATFGLDLEVVERAQRNNLLNSSKVQTMGCWPEGNSIAVLDDTLIIKLSDREEAN